MDMIEVDGLRLRCVLGVADEERRERQDVVIDLTVGTQASAALAADGLNGVWNYRTAVKAVIGHVEFSAYRTVERLACEVARLLVVGHAAPYARVRVRKPGALRFADSVGVVVERQPADYQPPTDPGRAGGDGRTGGHAMTAVPVGVWPAVVVDLGAAATAAAAFLSALGLRLDDAGTMQTPARMARAYAELLTPRAFDPTTFADELGYNQLVVLRRVPSASVCEHHALPFLGTADVGYLPAGRIIGLSKLARVVELFARRLQVQERMTQQIADWLAAHLTPKGVGVVVRAEHLCMRLRGAQVAGTSTVTSALHGLLLEDGRCREEFLALTRDPQADPR